MKRGCAVLGALLATVASPHLAAADDKAACVAAYEKAQLLRKSGDDLAARDQLLVCARESCPTIVKRDCVPWLGEVSRAIASVVVDATDVDANAIYAVTVTIDGKVVATRLDGRPIEVSPGAHSIRLEAQGAPAVERTITLGQGEKNRELKVILDVKKAPVAPPPAAKSRPVPVGAIVLGAVGIASLGVFATLGLVGDAKKSELDQCKPACNPSDVSQASAEFVGADIALGVGGAALIGAVTWFLLRPTSTTPATSVGLSPLEHGAFFSLRQRF